MSRREEVYQIIEKECIKLFLDNSESSFEKLVNSNLPDWLTILTSSYTNSFIGDTPPQPYYHIVMLGAICFACMATQGPVGRDNSVYNVQKDQLDNFTFIRKVINEERDYQDNLGPNRTDGHQWTLGDVIILFGYYLREAQDNYVKYAGNVVSLQSVRKLAAIIVKYMEQLD